MQQVLRDIGIGQGVATLLAVAMIVTLRFVLPEGRRRYAFAPILLLLLHVGALALSKIVPARSLMGRGFELSSLFFLLMSMGRAGFLIGVFGLGRRRAGRSLPKIFQDIVQTFVYALIVLVVLSAAGVEPGSLLTTSALLTAVVGLSLQGTLGNMFAGLAIQAQRAFTEGDWIQFDEEPSHIGKVVEMNWRAVRLLTLDEVEIVVPNTLLSEAPLRNYTRPTDVVRRSLHVLVPHDTPPRHVHELLLQTVRSVPQVLTDPAPSIVTSDFTERGVELWVRYYIRDFRMRERIAGEVRDHLWYALHRAGIGVPPPRRHVQLEELSEARSEEAERRRLARQRRTIDGVDFLRVLPEDARDRLARASDIRLYAPNENVIEAGSLGQELFIIERGEVRVFAGPASGPKVEVAVLGPGHFFGEMALMTGEARKATVRTTGEAEVLVLGKEAVRRVLDQAPELVETISRVLAEREEALERGRRRVPESSPKQTLEERTGALLTRIKRFLALD